MKRLTAEQIDALHNGPVVDVPIPGKSGTQRLPADHPRAVAFLAECRKVFLDLGGRAGDDAPHVPPPLSIVFTAGIGDTLALEAFLSQEERDRLTTLSYVWPTTWNTQPLFAALPNYPLLKTHKRSGRDEAIKEGAEDWDVPVMFPTLHTQRPYVGSSFLMHTLCQRPAVPEKSYVYICPFSDWGKWDTRNFSDADWAVTLRFLERTGILGLVVSKSQAATRPPKPAPVHSRILDLQNKTTLLESIELVKGAAGYIGIDSWPSILAAKLFSTPRMIVKSTNSLCYRWQKLFYAPRTDFGFMRQQIEEPAWE